MGKRLQDKVAIIVGAGSVGPGWGNGKATAVLFAREGAKVFAVDMNREAALETKNIINNEGGACEIFNADVTDSKQVAAMVDACLAAFGKIDILHNNVGIVVAKGIAELDEKTWDKVMNVNLKSQFLTCKYVLPHMERQGGGAIINISSIGSVRYLGYPCSPYMASKAAITALTVDIAMEYAGKNIRANSILPGLMNTPMIQEPLKAHYAGGDIDKMIDKRNAICPTGKMGTGWDVAHAALFLASDEAQYITGTELVVDGGIIRRFSAG
ncbi:MAG: SDR family oxidoreductase [Deltaproteobacteria bacterium]|nr:SDR family oxidoreductase [Deltaproteobacteria bacterium]